MLAVPLFTVFPATDSFPEEPITWRECLTQAAKTHPDLQSAKEKAKQAQANVGISRSAMLPQIDASASATKSKSASSPTGEAVKTYSYDVSGQQLLFDSGKSLYDMKKYQKTAESMDTNYLVTSATIRQNLRYAFIQLLSAQESAAIEKDIVRIRKRNLELVKMRHQSGLEHRGSLLTAEANLAQAEYEVAQAQRSIALARRSLAKNMGFETVREFKADGLLVVTAAYDRKPDLDQLVDSTPQLKYIIQQRMAAEYAMKASKLDYSPRIYGVGSIGRTGSDWPPSGNEYSLGVQMSFNLFQGGKSWYNAELSEAQMKQLFADEKSTRNTLLLNMEQAWANLKNGIESVRVQRKYVKAAEERAAIADAQYSIGTIVFDNWTIIQDNLVNAKKNYINAATNALQYEADWILANGGTLEYE